ncbi:unnamed protein product [Camellia sinensis]
MKEEMEEGKISSYSDDQEKFLNHPPRPRKGGLRTIPFILVNESFEKVASFGLMPNMIFYLMESYSMEAATASIFLSLWSAMSNTLAIFGAFLSDSYLGRFPVIVLGSISSLLGMTLLWLTAMLPQLKPPSCEHFINSTCNNSPTSAQLAVLFSSFGLISIGAGCIRPCSIAFGADQLDNKDNPDNDRTLQSFFNWYYASTGLSTVLALTVIVYIQEHLGWQVGFGIPVVFMVFSALMFLLGSSLYIKVVASESLFTSFVQVLVAARKNRKNRYSDDFYHKSQEPKFCAPTENLRCLNKACIITDPERDLNPDGSASNPWRLCTVEQVESLKALLKAIPMFSAGIMVILIICQNSFSTLQAKTMNRHIISSFEIPAGSFSVFMIVTLTLWVAFYDRFMVALLAKCTGRPLGLSPRVRMGVGLLLSCLATVVSAVIERKRRSKAIEQGFQDDPNAVVDMTAIWLVPQYAILGLAEAFYSIGQIEFFYSQFPKSMTSISMALSTLGMAVSSLVGSLLVKIVNVVTTKGGKVSWLSSNLNRGHVDYYYCLLTFLGLLNFIYFLICCRVCEPIKNETTRLSSEVGEEESDYSELPSA